MQSSVAGLLHAFDPGGGNCCFLVLVALGAMSLSCHLFLFKWLGLSSCQVNEQIKAGVGTFFVLRLKDADSEGRASVNFS